MIKCLWETSIGSWELALRKTLILLWKWESRAFNCEGHLPNSFSWCFSDHTDNRQNSHPSNHECGCGWQPLCIQSSHTATLSSLLQHCYDCHQQSVILRLVRLQPVDSRYRDVATGYNSQQSWFCSQQGQQICVLSYVPGFDSRWCHWNFSLT